MNATSTSPLCDAATTGCDDGPVRPASTWTGAWNTPPARRDTNTWDTAATVLVYTSAPVPSRAIDSPLSDWMLALGPSTTASLGASEGARARAAPAGRGSTTAAASTHTHTDS